MQSPHLQQSFKVLLGISLLVAITFLVYRPGLYGPFLLDDDSNIPQKHIQELSPFAIRTAIFSSGQFEGLARSIANLSFSLTHHFNRSGPYAFKYQNLMLHIINGLLVFWLIYLLINQTSFREFKSPPSPYLALAITALWLLHPLQVSTVLYAVQRLVLLASLFTLTALICYVKGRILSRRHPIRGFILSLGGSTFFGLLAFLSKETGALLPLYIGLVQFFFFADQSHSQLQRRLTVILITILVAAPLTLAVFFVSIHANAFLSTYAGRDFTLPQRLMSELHALGLYIRLVFIPVPGQMSLFHDGFPITRSLDVATLALGIAYLTLIAIGLLLRRRAPIVGFGILWFFACHAMESTVLPLELVFEHRNYLALLGPALVIVVLMSKALPSFSLRNIRGVLFMVGAGLLALNTSARAFAWGDLELLMRSEYQEHPRSSRVLSALVSIETSRGDTEAARAYLRELQALNLDHAAPELVEIGMRCHEESISPDIFARAEWKLEHGLLSPYPANELNSLVKHWSARSCPSVSSDALLRLTTAATRSNRTTTQDIRCLVAYDHTLVLMQAQRWEQADPALAEMFAQCSQTTVGISYTLLQNLASRAADSDNFGSFLGILNAVSARRGDDLALLFDALDLGTAQQRPDTP